MLGHQAEGVGMTMQEAMEDGETNWRLYEWLAL